MAYIQRDQEKIMEKHKEKTPFPYGKDLFICSFFSLYENINDTGKKQKEKGNRNARFQKNRKIFSCIRKIKKQGGKIIGNRTPVMVAASSYTAESPVIVIKSSAECQKSGKYQNPPV